MSHDPRWIPENALVEVTTRTFQGRYFLRPTPRVREIVVGILGRAQRMYRMEVCLVAFMSNHWHGLLLPEDARQLASFMNYVNGEIARKILPLTPWDGKFWARPYDAIVVSDEPEAQLARFEYLLGHGVKEHLVERPEQWIGVHGVHAWLEGKPLRGYWFDKTRESRTRRLVRNRGKSFDRLAFADEETLKFSPLPYWRAEGLDLEAIRGQIREMVTRIVDKARLERKAKKGRRVLGTVAVLAKSWDHRPAAKPKRIRPRFHFRSRRSFERLSSAWGEFLADYRRASAAYRAGDSSTRFPERCFPPAAGFTFDGRVGRLGPEI